MEKNHELCQNVSVGERDKCVKVGYSLSEGLVNVTVVPTAALGTKRERKT